MGTASLDWIDRDLTELREGDLYRSLVSLESASGPEVVMNDRNCILLASNNYLGLAGDHRLAEAATIALQRYGSGAAASPLISGWSALHEKLERKLADLKNVEECLLFASGYQANVGTISALSTQGDIIYSDELNHASIVDGCRLSRAQVVIYRHGDIDHLRSLIKSGPAINGHRLIVTDSVFSMDGDLAPLPALVELAEEYECLLMVDEAHSTGVLGERGGGAIQQFGLEGRVSVVMGTLSKAIASSGGFVAGAGTLIDYLRNRSRSYIYSTALPPASVGAALAALDVIEIEPNRRSRLLEIAQRLADGLKDMGYRTFQPSSAIVPLLVGSSANALALASALLRQGVFCPAIRPPTVPEGKSRLRITPIATHNDEQIERVLVAFGLAREELGEGCQSSE